MTMIESSDLSLCVDRLKDARAQWQNIATELARLGDTPLVDQALQYAYQLELAEQSYWRACEHIAQIAEGLVESANSPCSVA